MHQEDMRILNVYIANIRTSKQMKQKWIDLNGEKFRITVKDFNTTLQLTEVDRSVLIGITKQHY